MGQAHIEYRVTFSISVMVLVVLASFPYSLFYPVIIPVILRCKSFNVNLFFEFHMIHSKNEFTLNALHINIYMIFLKLCVVWFNRS